GGVKWMNSAGLGIIMASLTTLRGSGGDLKLANVTERVLRPIQITKLNRVIEIFDSLDKAVDSYATGG
ncbi:STAS domain-containing protein, partial [bacterium]|nr:STAS domain-containing protein [bacterium]